MKKVFVHKKQMIFLNSNGITWQLVERKFDGLYHFYMNQTFSTISLYSSLGIVERIIRTLRDMSFQFQSEIGPEILKKLVSQYNNAPQLTLSAYGRNQCVNKVVYTSLFS